MMKKVIKLRYAIIIYILVFLFSTGATFALSDWMSGNTLLSGGTMCFDVEYSSGEDIDMSGMTASLEFTEGSSASTTLSFSRKSNCELYGKGTITANVTTNSSVNLSSGGLKYRVIKNNDIEPVATGSVSKVGENVIYEDFYILDMVDTYTVYFWLDANNIDNTYLEASFSGTVGSSAVSTPNYPGHIDEDVPVTNELLANFYYYDNEEEKIDYVTETCVGTGDSCTLMVPEEVTGTTGEYGNSYAGVSTSTGNMTSVGVDKVKIEENTTFYALYSTEVNYKYYDTNWKVESVYRNSYINNSNQLVTVLADANDSTETITASSSSNATLLGYSNTGNGIVSHNSINDVTNSNATSMIEVYQYAVNYAKGDGVSSIGKTSDSCNFTSPSTSCSVTTPSITPEDGYSALGWYDTTGTKVADQNTGLTINSNNVTYTAKASDSSVPVCLINTTNTLKSSSQTATLNCTDNIGVVKYYFGTSSSGTPNTEINSTTSMNITKTINSAGTYYLIAEDTNGNKSVVVSQVYYSYTVDNYLLNVTGTKNTYTTNNYTKVNSNTYIAPKDATITMSSIYTTPTGGEYVAASVGSASTTAPTTVTSATLTGNTIYTMWFNRLEYTITVATTTGGANKVTTQNNTTGVTATSSSESKTITIRYGESLTSTATNSTGYTFSKFSGLSTSTNKTVTVTPNTNGTITANFTANPLTFANQTITKTFSTSSQTATVTAASNGTGTYTYAEKSEKNASGTSTSYISLSGTTITIAANTPAGTYTYVITATDSGSKVTKDATYTVIINKQTVNAPTNVAVSTAGVVTWTASSNASGYQISIDNNNWTTFTSGSSYLSTITAGTGNRTVYVRAVNSDTTNYTTPSSSASKTVSVYKVTIQSNNTTGGTVNTTSLNVISGATYSTSSNVLTIKGGSTTLGTSTATAKTGYSFSSWSSTGGTITSATIVTANFTANTYTLTITSGSGGSIKVEDTTKSTSATASSGGSATLSVTYGDTIKVTTTPSTGYYLSSLKHGSTSMSSGGTFTATGAETIAATWSVKYIYVLYNANGGTINSSAGGYSWTTDGNGTIYQNGSKYYWTIQYGGSTSSGGLSNWNNSSYIDLTRSGYTVIDGKEWNTSANGTGASFDHDVVYSYSSFMNYVSDYGDHYELNLYVNWVATYTVSYNANGGSGAPSNQTKTHGITLTLSNTIPTRSGYTFLGWSTSSSATSPTYSAGDTSFTTNANITLYAVWEENVYQLSSGSSTYAPSISTAISRVSSGGTITALKNNNIGTLVINKSLTLNTNGKTLTSSGTLDISKGYTVTINGSGTITNSANTTIITNQGTLTAGAVTLYTGGTSSSVYGIQNYAGICTISGATITAGRGIYNTSSSKLNITSGKITGANVGVYNSSTGTNAIDMNGGTVISTGGIGLSVNAGTVSITGGTVSSDVDHGIQINANGVLNMSSGIVEAPGSNKFAIITVNSEAKANITGGTLTGQAGIGGSSGTITMSSVEVTASVSAIYTDGANVTINSGNFTTSTASTADTIYNSGATVNIEGGNITSINANAVFNDGGTITISGGTISAGKRGVYNAYGGKLTMISGKVIGTEYGLYCSSSTGEDGTVNIINMSGGTIVGHNQSALYLSGGTTTVTGGVIETPGTNTTAVAVRSAATLNLGSGTGTSSSKSVIVANKTSKSAIWVEGVLNYYIGAYTYSNYANAINKDGGTVNLYGGRLYSTSSSTAFVTGGATAQTGTWSRGSTSESYKFSADGSTITVTSYYYRSA